MSKFSQISLISDSSELFMLNFQILDNSGKKIFSCENFEIKSLVVKDLKDISYLLIDNTHVEIRCLFYSPSEKSIFDYQALLEKVTSDIIEKSEGKSIKTLCINHFPKGEVILLAGDQNEMKRTQEFKAEKRTDFEYVIPELENLLPNNFVFLPDTRNYRLYNYRFLPEIKICNESEDIKPEIKNFSVSYLDGSYNNNLELPDKLSSRGKPYKLAITFFLGKNKYTVRFETDYEKVSGWFDKFYGNHPDTKSDLIISIDLPGQKYELMLYRQGLPEPVKLSEEDYSVIVFKNKFEEYRSENYKKNKID